MLVENLSIGADPEFALVDNISGEYISAEGKIGGSKKKPRSIGNGCFAQEDCVGVEFNIPPAKTPEEFVSSVMYSLDMLRESIPHTISFSWIPIAEFDPIFLSTKQAKESGCEPDLNAYGLEYTIPSLESIMLRAFGGHVHLGYTSSVKNMPGILATFLDVYVNVPTLKFEDSKAGALRRSLYGRAGSYRAKPYGMEYRSLSSWWLASSEKMRLVYDLVQNAVSLINTKGLELYESIMLDKNHVMNAINNHDKLSQEYIIHKYQTPNI